MTITKDYKGLQLIGDEYYKLNGDLMSDEDMSIELDKPLLVCGNIGAEGNITADHDIFAERNIIVKGYIFAEGYIYAGGNITAGGYIFAEGYIYAGENIDSVKRRITNE